jgi:hypothetical protein
MQAGAAAALPFRCRADPYSTGYASLDFRDVDGRNEEKFAVPVYPRCERVRRLVGASADTCVE